MEIILYTIIFIIGCFFGSFFTLAVYRIPRKEDILIKHSYCPNCNHKLGFLDLFPVLSYIFLMGKCRYCKNKIRPRYLLLELFSGVTFLLYALSIKINIYNINFFNIMMMYIYISVLFIIAGIDKEKIKIEKSVLIFGFCIELVYIIYQCILKQLDIYKYVMYSMFLIVLLVVSAITLKKKRKLLYSVQILFLSFYIIMFCGSIIYILSVIMTLLIIAFCKVNSKAENLPVGFFICTSNIITIIITNFIFYYLM